MKKLYVVFSYLILPFLMIRLWWKGFKNPAYREHWQERLGHLPIPQFKSSIWVHAVSLGETISAIPLIKNLRTNYPKQNIIVTTSTPTGFAQLQKSFTSDTIFYTYAPFDCPKIVKKFLGHVKPKLIIIMETELWPNLLFYANQLAIPIILANARLSPKSLANYQKIRSLTKMMLNTFTIIAAQSKLDADRFIKLGADIDQVMVTGNIKFDMTIPENLHLEAAKLREFWGINRKIWIAASTHEGEEQQTLEAYKSIKQTVPSLLLVLVPRHPERFASVTNLVKQSGFKWISRRLQEKCSADTEIIIGDTMGELPLLYAASDVAFVGKSLAAFGGHNLLEPAMLGIPIITGPHLDNFIAVKDLLLEQQALIIVKNPDELADKVKQLLFDQSLRQQMVNGGLNAVAQNRGSLAKINELITKTYQTEN